ncbi:MAG: hypothetical protein V8R27_06410 [Oscillospiraceae bacterium]
MGCVNAVNLTDGIDGLASGVTAVVMFFFLLAAMLWKMTSLGIFSGALFGSLVGFFALYNHHPAKCFMGDTGSLFLGGAVAALAFAMDMPLVLILVGIITFWKLCPILYRLDTSSLPTASAFSKWRRCTTILSGAAGAR